MKNGGRNMEVGFNLKKIIMTKKKLNIFGLNKMGRIYKIKALLICLNLLGLTGQCLTINTNSSNEEINEELKFYRNLVFKKFKISARKEKLLKWKNLKYMNEISYNKLLKNLN